MTDPFYESDVIKEELANMQQLYKDLYDLSVTCLLYTSDAADE